MNVWIYDCEVSANDWLFVFKCAGTDRYEIFHNDNEPVLYFLRSETPMLAGFNSKHYDQWILKAVCAGFEPEEVKQVNDDIIIRGLDGWNIPELKNTVSFSQYDLMDDCQDGISLKAFEAHSGMDIRETTVDFNINRPWTDAELQEMIFYCKHDVDATEKLNALREGYLKNKIAIGKECGLPAETAIGMTNARLTAEMLRAKPPAAPWKDERDYTLPSALKTEYIPQEVLEFFNGIHDLSIPSEEYFSRNLKITVGGCPVVIGFGGIHAAIPSYTEESTETRTIRNKDVASYYPHQMTINGYCSRNIPSPQIYADTIERRVQAKRAGDKATSNALKLVLNTTYGAMLNRYNPLYDPLMGRSVCISGQLQLLELAEHLVQECHSLKIIQLNTDGIMVSFDNSDERKWQEITQEWQDRTGFELEEDLIRKIVQKDVNNYIEIPMQGEPKIKGGVLVRGIAPAGAFNINNNACVVSKAIKDYLAGGVPVEQTIMTETDPLQFQLVAKVGGTYGKVYHQLYDPDRLEEVQKCNRVYASTDWRNGGIYKTNLHTGKLEKVSINVLGMPLRCAVDNDNHIKLSEIDRDWYIRNAERWVDVFTGKKPGKRNTRKIHKNEANIAKILKGMKQNG